MNIGSKILIKDLWATQKNLKRADQIPHLVDLILDDVCLDKIELHLCEDGEIQINNGHHRVIAMALAGKKELPSDCYCLLESDRVRSRVCKIDKIIAGIV
jgi:hypothetical protein